MNTSGVNVNHSDYTPYGVHQNSPKSAPLEPPHEMEQSNDKAEISELAREMAGGREIDNVNTAKTYEQQKFNSTESRENEGARLDAIFNDFRKKYGEEEAIHKFNEYMESEGYEIDNSAMNVTAIGGANKIKLYGAFAKLNYHEKLKVDLTQEINTTRRWSYSTGREYQLNGRESENFTMTSYVNGHRENGQTTYTAKTWVKYDAAVNKDISDVLDIWKNRNIEELSEQAGFDVGDYISNYQDQKHIWGKSFAAESVSTNLADIMKSVLSNAGIELGAGENVSFIFNNDKTGLYASTNFGDEGTRSAIQTAINKAMENDPSILQSFKAENEKVAEYNLRTLAGSFDNGLQKSVYVQQRVFLLAGDNQSAMIMGSGLDNVNYGYTYKKKISDTFDISADVKRIIGTADRNSGAANYEEGWAKTRQLMDEIRNSV